MEKRVLGAFGLIILTWIGYYYIIYPMYAPQRPSPVDRTVPQQQPGDFATGDDPASAYPPGENTESAFDSSPAFDAPPDAAKPHLPRHCLSPKDITEYKDLT